MESYLYFTDNARNKLLETCREQDCVGLRLGLKKTGCAGWQCFFEAVTVVDPSDRAIPLEAGLHIFLPVQHEGVLKGTRIDYIKTDFESRFQFSVPKQQGECGCGESFHL